MILGLECYLCFEILSALTVQYPRIHKKTIQSLLFKGKVIILLGPRQVGKTTLLRQIAAESEQNSLWLNADERDIRERLTESTSTQLQQLIGPARLLLIDEAQQVEQIGRTLKLLADNFPDIQVVATGSSALELRNRLNEPLTGRKTELRLHPISYAEIYQQRGALETRRLLETRLVYGSYPEVLTRPGEEELILQELVSSYLYKDLLMLDGVKKPALLEKLLLALAYQVGSEVSYHELGQLLGKVDPATVERYIDLLEKAFVVFRLPALSRNLRNEIKKGKKIYFWDNGVRNTLIRNFQPMGLRVDQGALWENFLISERMKANEYARYWVNAWFWRTRDQAEIDYIEERDAQFRCYEFSYSKTRKKSMPKSFQDTYGATEWEVLSKEHFESFLL